MAGIICSCAGCGTKNRIPEKKQHLSPVCGKCGERLVLGSSAVAVQLGDHDFQKFIGEATLPVMIDFFSPSCGPCQAIAPLINRLAGTYLGKVIVAKLDTSLHPGTAAHYQIRGVPSLLFFRDGSLVDQIVGAPPEQELVSRLDRLCS